MAREEPARWHCANRDCDWFMVATTAEEADAAPKCVCGSAMTRSGPQPVLSYLEFLRDEMAIADKTEMDRE